jgi:hypothetical protein
MPNILRHHSGLIFKGPQTINFFLDIPTLENATTMSSQNAISSKATPHPRIETSFTLNSLSFRLPTDYIPDLPHFMPYKCNWPLSLPLNCPTRCSYSLTDCSVQLPFAQFSYQPSLYKISLLPCSSFLLNYFALKMEAASSSEMPVTI